MAENKSLIYDANEDESASKNVHHQRGLGSSAETLDLSFADAKESKFSDEYLDNGIQEQSILVIFDLPDGSQGEGHFKLGQTVEYLKSFVENEYGISMSSQSLSLDGKLMMDPLSLLDFPEAKSVDELYVRVDGYLPADSKK